MPSTGIENGNQFWLDAIPDATSTDTVGWNMPAASHHGCADNNIYNQFAVGNKH